MKGKKRMSRAKKVALIMIIIVVIAALVYGIHYTISYLNYKHGIDAIQVQNIDLTTIEDGEYYGDADVGFIRVKVRVLVENHILTELELLEHYNDRGETANALPQKILDEQRIDVDAVTGATSSSKVIQEAVYNALTGERTLQK